MAIAALDKSTIKQLTTTQVITNVYSAVKELIENALDGGANNIEVYLKDKGLSFIEVRDNGKGISEVDSAYVALPYYTSKISNISDLESLESYGFRGEALNALCRVSEVKIITRTHEDDNARCYTFSNNGSIQKAEFCSRAIGTTVQVLSLFKNFPVRRLIISNPKQTIQDVKSIENLLHEFGICHIGLRISYRVDNVTIFSKIPGETMKENLVNVFGRKFANQYEFLNFKDSAHEIRLIIPQKNLIDLSNLHQINYQYIFVNNRPVILKEFEKLIVALLSMHFGEKISVRKKPVFILNITVPASSVDVNLVPNKTSVLLVNQSSITKIVEQLVVDYYGIILEAETLSDSLQVSTASLSSLNHESNEPLSKKRKIERNERKWSSEKPIVKVDEHKKENITTNIETEMAAIGISPIEKEPVSQLPRVNLGEDFSTQFVDALPTLSTQQVQAVTNTMEHLNSSPSHSSERLMPITESQWSRGQVPHNFTGGTDVKIIGINEKNPQGIIRECTSGNAEANKRGFAKFSQQARPKLIKNNPEMNLVQIAKLLTEEWKKLTTEERQQYRDLGMHDKSLSMNKLSSSAVKKVSKLSPKDSTANKKRVLNLLEHMKEPKFNGEKEKTCTKTFIPWNINKQTLLQSFHNKRKKKTMNSVIGSLNNKIWIVRTNKELWCLDVDQLFQGLQVRRDFQAAEDPEFILLHLQRWLKEKDSMGLMSLIYELQ